MSPVKQPLLPETLICGMPVRLLAIEAVNAKWTTALVGARPGRYLIVEMPRAAGMPVKLDTGSVWTVTFISDGQVYSFQSEILGHTYRLVPLLFLQYPDQAEVSALRSEKRYPVNIPVVMVVTGLPPAPENEAEGEGDDARVEYAPPDQPLKGLAVDISESGFMVAATQALRVDTSLLVQLYLDGQKPLDGLAAEVKTCRRQKGASYLGLALTAASRPEAMARLASFIQGIENTPLRL